MAELSYHQALRYNRQIMLPDMDLEGQENVCASRVLVIGLGGLGCGCAPYLAAAGVGRLTLVDPDVVELSNLQRQILHDDSRIGQTKVASAAIRLQQINPHCRIETLARALDDDELSRQIGNHDLVVDCCDNLATRQQLNRLCYAARTPLVSAAAIRMEGQITTFLMNGQGPCYQCFSSQFGEQQLSCVEAGVLSPLVGVVGALQATEAIKVLAGLGTPLAGRLLLLDLKQMDWQTIRLPKRPDCPVCGNAGKTADNGRA